MKVSELFEIGDFTQSIGDNVDYLDRNDCQIEKMKKSEDAIILFLKRRLDGKEGQVHLRVQSQFKSVTDPLLSCINNKIIGLTLNQLDDFETNCDIKNLQGRLSLNKI